MRHLNRQLAGFLALLLAAVLSACTATGSGAAGSPRPASSSDPGTAADASPGCYGINESVDTPPLTIANLMPATTSVVVAQVKAIEGGVWSTKDGKKPDRGQKNGQKFSPGIETPVNLQVTRDDLRC